MFTLLSFIPAIFIHLIVFLGVVVILAASFLGMIPIINTYKIPGQLVGVLLLSIGLFSEGSLSYKVSVDQEMASLNLRISQGQTASAKVNGTIETVIAGNTNTIETKIHTITKTIKSPEGTKEDKICIIPQVLIDAHNNAVKVDTSPIPDEVTVTPLVIDPAKIVDKPSVIKSTVDKVKGWLSL